MTNTQALSPAIESHITAYAAHFRREERSGATIEKYTRDIQAFIAWLEGFFAYLKPDIKRGRAAGLRHHHEQGQDPHGAHPERPHVTALPVHKDTADRIRQRVRHAKRDRPSIGAKILRKLKHNL